MSIFDRLLRETGLSGSERRLVRGVVGGVVRDVRDGATAGEIAEGIGNRGLLEGTRELDPIARGPARSIIREQERNRRAEIREREIEEARQARLEEREARAGRGRTSRDNDGDSHYEAGAREVAGESVPVDQVGAEAQGDILPQYEHAVRDIGADAGSAEEPVEDTVPPQQYVPEPVASVIPISAETAADVPAAVPATTTLGVEPGDDMGKLIDRHFAGNNFTQEQRERLVDHIAHLNPAITDVNKLSIGQSVVMPDSPTVPDEVPRQDWAAIHAQYPRQSAPDVETGARMPPSFSAELEGQTFGARSPTYDI